MLVKGATGRVLGDPSPSNFAFGDYDCYMDSCSFIFCHLSKSAGVKNNETNNEFLFYFTILFHKMLNELYRTFCP